jgi:DNA invertase Pin-like site-specific DNA recombinase
MKYGYARVSSVGQDLTIQVQKLNEVGCDVIREEKVSGTSLKGRKEFETLMEFMREGDELVVTRIDRLARSIRDLQNIVYELKNKGVTLSATEQPIDTRTSAGKAFLDMLGVFSEFETNLRKERQMEGVRKAKERGVYKGRGRTIDASKIYELKQNGYGATKISKQLGITRQSVYRLLKEQPVQSLS